MKKLLCGVLVLALGYAAWHFMFRPKQVAPLVQRSYVALYGTATCGICAGYREDFGRMGIAYMDYDITNPSVQDQLYPRMRQAGLSTGSFSLPVIDVNGRILIRPELDTVEKLYRTPCATKASTKLTNLCQIKKNILPQDPLAVSGISMDKKPCAIIGDAVVGVGDKVGEAQVVEIQPDGVTFRDAQGKVFTKKLK